MSKRTLEEQRTYNRAKAAAHRARKKLAETGGKPIPHGKSKIKVGDRFGKLVVVEYVGLRRYGSGNTGHWKLKCDCGAEIILSNKRFRASAPNPRTACDKCSQKTCVICGDKYSHERGYDFCESPACVEIAYRARQKMKQERRKERWHKDENYRQLQLYYQHLRHVNGYGKIAYQKNKDRLTKASPDKKAKLQERRRVDVRRYKANIAKNKFLEDAQILMEKLNDDN